MGTQITLGLCLQLYPEKHKSMALLFVSTHFEIVDEFLKTKKR